MKGMLEMGWLFTEVAKYVNSVEGAVRGTSLVRRRMVGRIMEECQSARVGNDPAHWGHVACGITSHMLGVSALLPFGDIDQAGLISSCCDNNQAGMIARRGLGWRLDYVSRGSDYGPRANTGRDQEVDSYWPYDPLVRDVPTPRLACHAGEGGVASRGGPDAGPGLVQQAFVFSLREDLTEYYRLIAVLGAQLNLDAEEMGKASRVDGVPASTGTEGLTLRRLAVWVSDPLERLKILATLVTSAGHLKVMNAGSCGGLPPRPSRIMPFRWPSPSRPLYSPVLVVKNTQGLMYSTLRVDHRQLKGRGRMENSFGVVLGIDDPGSDVCFLAARCRRSSPRGKRSPASLTHHVSCGTLPPRWTGLP